MSLLFSAYLCNPFGVRIADASGFIAFNYARAGNDIGKLTMTLPGSFPARDLMIPDGRIELWRHLPSGREQLETDTTWLIKRLGQRRDAKGVVTRVVEAFTPLCLFREPGRIVNYAAESAQSKKAAAPADDLIKAFVRENIGGLASAAQRSAAPFLSVEPDRGMGASVPKSAAWRDVLKVCQELALASTQQGTYLAFDIVAPTPDSLEFRTYTGQRGTDHRFPSTQTPVIISPDLGNAGETELTTDYYDEVTYAIAGGQGEASNRVTASAQDTTRIGASPFGLRETFVTATQYKDDSSGGITNEARAAVQRGRPRTAFRMKILDTEDTQYGVHWRWGDYLTAQDFGLSFDARVEAVTVSFDRTKQTIEAWLRSDA